MGRTNRPVIPPRPYPAAPFEEYANRYERAAYSPIAPGRAPAGQLAVFGSPLETLTPFDQIGQQFKHFVLSRGRQKSVRQPAGDGHHGEDQKSGSRRGAGQYARPLRHDPPRLSRSGWPVQHLIRGRRARPNLSPPDEEASASLLGSRMRLHDEPSYQATYKRHSLARMTIATSVYHSDRRSSCIVHSTHT